MGDNTSPILLTDVPQPIATFNKPFELSELVAYLDGVIYLYNGGAVAVTCVSYEETGQTKYALADNIGQSNVAYLTVEGNTLLCSSDGSGSYLFDIDYKHQNKKFFPDTLSEFVGITCPSLTSDPSKYLICKIGKNSSSTEIRLELENGKPLCIDDSANYGEGTWFDSNARSHIATLVKLILQLEYDNDSAGGITVITTRDAIESNIGRWNFFTDGSAFIPLGIVSRFPNGSPILKDQYASQPVKICSFNRPPIGKEIERISMIVADRELVEVTKGTSWAENNSFNLESDAFQMVAEIVGNDMYIDNTSAANDIYDIDFDHQFRRSLPASDFKYNIQMPQLLTNPSSGEGLGILHEAAVPENFAIFAGNDNPLIVRGHTLYNREGAWANSLSWVNVQSLLQAIIAMEFDGFDVEPPLVAAVEYREALAFDFAITPLIPQSLS